MSGSSGDGLEIERKWLLHRLPSRLEDRVGAGDPRMEIWRIRQGYLTTPVAGDLAAIRDRVVSDAEVPTVGRIREIRDRDGAVRHIHTLKHGSGLVRREFERPITGAAFEAAWSETVGRRLEKVRWRIPEGGLLWEIDRFRSPAVVLAEVEAIDREAALEIQPPDWLAACIDREVTNDPEFTNAELAFRSARAGHGSPLEHEGEAG